MIGEFLQLRHRLAGLWGRPAGESYRTGPYRLGGFAASLHGLVKACRLGNVGMVLQRKGQAAGFRPLRLEHGPVVPLAIVQEWLGRAARVTRGYKGRNSRGHSDNDRATPVFPNAQPFIA